MIEPTKKSDAVIAALNDSGMYRKLNQVSLKRGENLDIFQFSLIREGRGTTLTFKIPYKNRQFVYETFKNARCACDGTKKTLIGLPNRKKLFSLDYSVFVIDYL